LIPEAFAIMKTQFRTPRLKRVLVNWKFRHLASLAIAAALIYGFGMLRPEWSPMHRWNRAFGDASFLMVAFVIASGPLSRLWRPAAPTLLWRREMGVWAVLAGLVHAGFILFGWVQLEWQRLFGFEFHPGLQQYVMFDKGFAFGNIIGFLALAYGLVLALTSNDLSQRWLSMSVWKYIQQGAYLLWAMLVAHTMYFLFIHFLDFHRQTPEPNLLQWPFVGLVLVIVTLQTAASWQTWRLRHRRSGFRSQAQVQEPSG
jgi:sulfoxide reductase heme-binding subunit YedZ